MKSIKLSLILAAALIGGGFTAVNAADDQKGHGSHPAIPKDYPLKKCPISDEGFDHGKPVKVTHEGTDVYLCCKDCVKGFQKDPAKYAKMVKDAAPKK